MGGFVGGMVGAAVIFLLLVRSLRP